jgi:hypothetical protein
MKIILRFAILILSISVVSAQLSPGDLSEPHEHLEGLKNCTKCHEIGKKVLPGNCLSCHELLNERIAAGEGLHAREEYQHCVECHSDHQGTNFELIWWKEGQNNFNHAKTGYTLQGKHLAVDCIKCHNPENITDKQKYMSQKKNLNKTFLGLDTKCNSCHLDEHRGQLDTQCAICHDFNAWKPAPLFDHNRTRFSLTGKHRSVDCIFCHKKIKDKSNDQDPDYLKFSGLTFSNCSNCHRDPHGGRLGLSCTKCHTSAGWKGVVNKNFNHDLTRFPLKDKHQGVTCDKCHRSNRSLKNWTINRCGSCHKDYHQGQFYHRQQKGACEECHTEEGFLPTNFTVEQHSLTKYPLQGAHLAVPCNLCHQKNYKNTIRFNFSSTECSSCHRDPHNREAELYLSKKTIPEGKNDCQYCHSVTSWALIDFDHTQTNFQLNGKHQSIRCKSCHKYDGTNPNISVILILNKKSCQDCHQDVHMGQFHAQGEIDSDEENLIRCDKCHTTLNWAASKFDHNRDSSFKLEGAHKRLNCSQCHKLVDRNGKNIIQYKPLNSSCSACHEQRSMYP